MRPFRHMSARSSSRVKPEEMIARTSFSQDDFAHELSLCLHKIAPEKAVEKGVPNFDPAVCNLESTALMRAIGLAYHWQRLLDEQRVATVAEIAEVEGIDVTQVRRVMRLTLLAPEVVERLISTPRAALEQVMRRPWPNGWDDQVRVVAPLA